MHALSPRQKLDAIALAVAPVFPLLRQDVFLSYEVPLVGRACASSYYRPGVWLWGWVWNADEWQPPPERGERRGVFGSRIIHLLDNGTLALTHYQGQYRRTALGHRRTARADAWSVVGALEVLEEAPAVLELREVSRVLVHQLLLRRGPVEALSAALDLAHLG